MLAKIKSILLLKEKEDLAGCQYQQRRKQALIAETTASTSHSETVND